MQFKPLTGRDTKLLSAFNNSLAGTVVVILLALSLFPVLLLGSATYLRSRQLLHNQTALQLEEITQVQVEQIKSSFTEGKSIIDMMASDFLFQITLDNSLEESGSAQKQNNLSNILLSYKDKLISSNPNNESQISIFRPDGGLVLSTDNSWKSLDFKHNKQVMGLLGSDDTTAVFNPAPVYINQVAVFTTRQILDDQGQAKAVLVWTATSPLFRNSLTSSQAFFPTAQSFFLTNHGDVVEMQTDLSHLQDIENSSGYQQRLNAILQEGSQDKATGFLAVDDITPVLGIVRWMPAIQLGYILQVPEQAIYSQVPILSTFNLALLGMALLLSGIIAFAASRSFVRPLLQLTEHAQRFAKGEWDRRAEFKRKDEIGQLANAFNNMVEELSSLYRSMEQKVEARTEQVRLASEVAVLATSAGNQREMIRRTVELVVERFHYTYAGLFLINSSGLYAELEHEHEPEASGQSLFDKRLRLGSDSLVGWVGAKNQANMVTDESANEYTQSTLLVGAHAEAAVPITLGSQVIAVLDVQSDQPDAFDNDTLSALQSLANQVASGMQNARLLETAEVNLAETSMLYRTSRQVSQAESEAQVLGLLQDVLAASVYVSGLYTVEEDHIRVDAIYDAKNPSAAQTVQGLSLPLKQVSEQFKGSGFIHIHDISTLTPFDHILSFYLRRGCRGALLFPIFEAGKLTRMVVLGEREAGQFNDMTVQPFANLFDVAGSMFSRFHIQKELEQRMTELGQARQDYEQEHFLLGSWLNNTPDYAYFKNRDGRYMRVGRAFATSLGKSSAEELVGQTDTDLYDLETAQQRAEEDLKLFETEQPEVGEVSAEAGSSGQMTWRLRSRIPLVGADGQVNGLLSISRDITEMKKTEEMAQQAARQLTTASEIARDASGTLELSELLSKAVNLVRDRFGFYHSSIFLIDPAGVYALLRESTGAVGQMMKEREHKLAVGSRSIVGQVTMLGKSLVINNVTQDPNYYANPLLPDTRAELAIPLKAGNQVLGALDVQSTQTGAYGEQEVTILRLLADQIAVAVMNANLYARSMENLEQHRQLHEITTQAASAATMEEALRAAVEGLRVALKGAAVNVYLTSGNQLELQATASDAHTPAAARTLLPGEGIAGRVMQERRPLLVTGQGMEPAGEAAVAAGPDGAMRAHIAAPIIYSGNLVGVLQAASEEAGAFDENTLDLLGLLASSLGAILSNAELISTVRKQVDRQQLIYEATSRIHRSVDIQTILETSASEIARAVGAKRAQIKISVGDTRCDKETRNDDDNGNGNNGNGNGYHKNGKEILK